MSPRALEDPANSLPEAVVGLALDSGVLGWVLLESPGNLVRRGLVSPDGPGRDARVRRDLVDVWSHFGPFAVALPPELDLAASVLDGLEVQTVTVAALDLVPVSALALEPSPWPSQDHATLVAMAAMLAKITCSASHKVPTLMSGGGHEAAGGPVEAAVNHGCASMETTSVSGVPPSNPTSPRICPSARTGNTSARRWLTVGDVMAEYGLSRAAVYRLPVRHFTPVGRRRRYLRQDVEAHFRASVHPVPTLVAVALRLPARDDEDLQAKWDKLADEMGL